MLRRVNQVDNYFKAKVESATPMTLVYMLYDRAIITLREAEDSLKERDRDKFCEKNIHAQDCIRELRTSLNVEVAPVATSLWHLYDFMIKQLVEAAITRENPVTYVKRVSHMLEELNNTWKTAEKSLQRQKIQEVKAQEVKAESKEKMTYEAMV